MFKSNISKNLTNLVNDTSGKITAAGKKTMESETVKKTIATVGTSSKHISSFTSETSRKVVAAGKATAKSEKVRKTVDFLGTSTKEVLNESRKIASNVIFNVAVVGFLFILLNSIFMIYGIYAVVSNFSWMNLMLVFGLLIAGIAFSVVAAYRCYTYGQFKIGLGIYRLMEGFFKMLIVKSVNEIEKQGHEKLKNSKISGLMKKNGNDIIQSSVHKVPAVIRKPIFLLMELVPFGDIVVEVIEESKSNVALNMEEQVMMRLDSYVLALKPHKKFTRFVGVTLAGNVVVMSLLVYLM